MWLLYGCVLRMLGVRGVVSLVLYLILALSLYTYNDVSASGRKGSAAARRGVGSTMCRSGVVGIRCCGTRRVCSKRTDFCLGIRGGASGSLLIKFKSLSAVTVGSGSLRVLNNTIMGTDGANIMCKAFEVSCTKVRAVSSVGRVRFKLRITSGRAFRAISRISSVGVRLGAWGWFLASPFVY